MYDQLARDHRWWFVARDHDHDGLPEYGSTDGTAIAAKWESGMDNAVRFDGITMLENRKHAWSMDQASVDLSAYLYREKLDLAAIAASWARPTIIGDGRGRPRPWPAAWSWKPRG